MFCPKCGNELIDGAAFCSACGTKLDFVPTGNSKGEILDDGIIPEEDTLVENERLGETITEESTAEGSGDLPGTDLNDYYQEEPAPKKDRRPLIIALCAAAAAVRE